VSSRTRATSAVAFPRCAASALDGEHWGRGVNASGVSASCAGDWVMSWDKPRMDIQDTSFVALGIPRCLGYSTSQSGCLRNRRSVLVGWWVGLVRWAGYTHVIHSRGRRPDSPIGQMASTMSCVVSKPPKGSRTNVCSK